MHSTTTPLDPRVREKMIPLLSDDPRSAGGLPHDPRRARAHLDEARRRVAALCGAPSDEAVIFTSGGTESCNMALKGLALAELSRGGARRRCLAAATEHTAVLYPLRTLNRLGFEFIEVPVDRHGVMNLEALESLLGTPTLVVTAAAVNAETGTRQPLDDIVRIAHAAGSIVHTDACVAAACGPVDVVSMGVDLASFSAHKIGGPRGCGALYARDGVRLLPLIEGGTAEGGRRGGTENIAGIGGFGLAAEILRAESPCSTSGVDSLAARLEASIMSVPGVRLNGHPVARARRMINVSVDGVDGEALMTALALRGIAVSSGSSCYQETGKPSHVLLAMGLEDAARGSVLFSLGRGTTVQDIDSVVSCFGPIVATLRALSPDGVPLTRPG